MNIKEKKRLVEGMMIGIVLTAILSLITFWTEYALPMFVLICFFVALIFLHIDLREASE